ncbi:Helix-turn-helix domain-containing protein [Streptomyces sp. PAN_FS17]|nr:Helix-turn-helix domain-containing protein [Streptomyces sp. PAN_FS17]
MSTDYQQAREALGRRLKELRLSAPGGRLTGTQLAQRLGWPHSKVYKLEGGRQTALPEDLQAWATAVGHADTAEELVARLKGFESHIRSWGRQLRAGHRPVQDIWNVAHLRQPQPSCRTAVQTSLPPTDRLSDRLNASARPRVRVARLPQHR